MHDRAHRQNGVDFDPNSANALLLFAWLFPQQLVDRIVDTIEAACNTPYPVEGRAEKLVALASELNELQRFESALVDRAIKAGDAAVTHDPACPPEAVLSVRVANGGGA